MKLPHKIGLFFVLFVMSSCVKDVNFSQIDDLYAHTPLVVPFFSFELSQQHFIDDSNNLISEITDESILRITDLVNHSANSQFSINMIMDNHINRAFIITFDFNDAQENTLFTKVIPVQASILHQEHSILIADSDFNNFLITDHITMHITLLDGTSFINPADPWLVLQSSISLDYVF